MSGLVLLTLAGCFSGNREEHDNDLAQARAVAESHPLPETDTAEPEISAELFAKDFGAQAKPFLLLSAACHQDDQSRNASVAALKKWIPDAAAFVTKFENENLLSCQNTDLADFALAQRFVFSE